MAAHPERYEWHFQDETHLDTNPHLVRVRHRIGQQPTLPAAGTNWRLTVFGSVAAQGRGRSELLTVQQDSAGFAHYLAALDARHEATGRQVILVLDNGPCHVSKATQAALAERAAWLEVIPLARSSPHRNPKEHEWRVLKRDHRGHLAPTLRAFVDSAVAGLRMLGGEPCAIIDEVPHGIFRLSVRSRKMFPTAAASASGVVIARFPAAGNGTKGADPERITTQ